MGKRILTVFIAVMLITTTILLSGCGSTPKSMQLEESNEPVDLDFTDEDFNNILPQIQSEDPFEIPEYQLIAENDHLQLYYKSKNEAMNRDESAIAVRDRSNGYV